MWAIFRAAGWAGLSAATAIGWMAAFLLVVRWAGPLRAGRALPRAAGCWRCGRCSGAWCCGPDMFSMLAFGAQLLALDAFARGRTRALAVVPAGAPAVGQQPPALAAVADHPGLFLADLALRGATWRLRAPGRAWRSPRRSLLTFATPLGFRIVLAPFAHGAVAGDLPRARRRVPPHLDDVARARAGAGDGRARRVGAVADAPRDAAVRCGASGCCRWRWSSSAVRGLMFFGVVSVADLPALRAARERRGRDAAAGRSATVTRRVLGARRPGVHGAARRPARSTTAG